MAISETKGQGWRAISTQWRKASDILTSTLAAFLFSSQSKRERDREAHLNNYASAYNSSVQQTHKKGNGSRGSLKLLRQRLQQGETTITPQD